MRAETGARRNDRTYALVNDQRLARQRLTARILEVLFAELSPIDAQSRRRKSRLVARFQPF
jgi:hypothetical protein